MEFLLSEFFALSVFFGGIILAKLKLLRIVTMILFFAGAINFFLYNGVLLLVLAVALSLVGIAWRFKLSKWYEY